MSALTPAEAMGRAASVLAEVLRPFVEMHKPNGTAGESWADAYAALDRQNGISPRVYSLADPRFLLKVIAFQWQHFDGQVSKQQGTYARELIQSLNIAAHEPAAVTARGARRAIDTMDLLAESVGGGQDFSEFIAALTETGPFASPAPVSAPHEDLMPSDEQGPEAPDHDAPSTEPTIELDDLDVVCEDPELPSGTSRAILEAGSLRTVLYYREAINYALVSNGVSPLIGIELVNSSLQPVSIEKIRVGLEAESEAPTDSCQLDSVTVPAGESVHIDGTRFEWALDHRRFARLDEAIGTRLTLDLTIDSEVHHAKAPVRLLARDEWWARSIPEILAAFVTPNSVAVTGLLRATSALLHDRTGSPSLEGYQSGPERALEIGRAIYDALTSLEITYVEAPASFEGTGQKIRSAVKVLEDRQGTCLDLAVLYAGALEQAGLNPVITLVPGHAFAGFLLEDRQLPELAVTDRNVIDNLVRSSLLVPVETTVLTAGTAASFERARSATAVRFDSKFSEVVYVLDVRAAHRRIRPLPKVTIGGSGDVVIEVEKPSPTPLPRIPQNSGALTSTSKNLAPVRVERWRSALLDLSLRNPLLKLKKTSGVSLEIPERSLPELEDMLSNGQAFTLHSAEDLPDIYGAQGKSSASQLDDDTLHRILVDERTLYVDSPSQRHDRQLDALRRNAKTVLEETGANNLFLTLGALEWSDGKSETALAPLYLIPVRITGRKNQGFSVTIDDGATPLPNYCLIEKLRRDFDLEIPALAEPPVDESGIDVPRILQLIRTQLVDRNLAFTVKPHVRLALLQFATLEMWRDVTDNWTTFLKNPVVRHFVETPTDAFDDPVAAPQIVDTDEATSYLPVPIDGSQLRAVRWATSGRTFVLEGPPGTGKSQTITNMIADSLANGRKLLFVAEKQAALDVVRRRLDQIGLGKLCLDLHGRTQSINAVRTQLLEAWEARTSGNPSAFKTLRSQHERLVGDLAEYPHTLHHPGPDGHSVWTAQQDVLALSAQLGDRQASRVPRFAVPARALNGTADLKPAYAAAGRLQRALERTKTIGGDHEWFLAGSRREEVTEDAELTCVRQLLGGFNDLPAPARRLLARTDRPDHWRLLADWVADGEDGNASSPSEAVKDMSKGWDTEALGLANRAEAFMQQFRPLLGVLRPVAFTTDTSELRSIAGDALSKSWPFKKKALSSVQPRFDELAASVAPHVWLRFLADLEALHAATSALVDESLGILGSRSDWDPRDPGAADAVRAMVERRRRAAEAFQVFGSSIAEFDALLSEAGNADKGITFGMPTPTLHPGSTSESIRRYLGAWGTFVQTFACPSDHLSRWQGQRSLTDRLAEVNDSWGLAAERGRLTHLERLRAVRTEAETLVGLGFEEFVTIALGGDLDGVDFELALKLGVATSLRDDRMESAYLDTFDGGAREATVVNYLGTTKKVREQLHDELPSKITAQNGITPDRPSNAQGAFRREIARKRGGSIRELISKHSEVLLDLTPCLLMSPQAVSKHLTATGIEFDTVIFDEASQIRVADAIGAMGRAKSVVVVGDSQQMPPTSMFATGILDDEAEDEDAAALIPADQESILSEAADSNIESLRLTWHYRSQDESLIAFSNKQYYHGDLYTFPAPPVPRPGMGVSVRRVNGTFDGGRSGSRTNEGEAEAILEEISGRLASDPQASIGVVTFNSQQRDLILDKLDQSPSRAIQAAISRESEALFVKNLENVQGDERDVIFFSLAFSRDSSTGTLRLNFGPLTAAGGERRLNVAITRARREVRLFTSFGASDIDLSRTRSQGMKDLRDYLAFAEAAAHGEHARTITETRDLHRDDVKIALSSAGLDVLEDVGMSNFRVDLAVRKPESDQWLAVLLDGPQWASRSIVADRDAVPNQVLTGPMGWARTFRIWLPTWLKERSSVVEAVMSAVESVRVGQRAITEIPAAANPPIQGLEDADGSRGPSQEIPLTTQDGLKSVESMGDPGRMTTAESISVDFPAAEDHSRFSGAAATEAAHSSDGRLPTPQSFRHPELNSQVMRIDFVPASMEHAGSRSVLDNLHDPANQSLVAGHLTEIIAAEGPIEMQRLARIVGLRFEMQKIHSSRRDEILKSLPNVRTSEGPEGTFFWPNGHEAASYRFFRRTPSGLARPITEIAPEEVANAMAWELQRVRAIDVDDLIRRTMEQFAFSRLGSAIDSRLRSALEQLQENGRAVVHSGRVRSVEHGTPPPQ